MTSRPLATINRDDERVLGTTRVSEQEVVLGTPETVDQNPASGDDDWEGSDETEEAGDLRVRVLEAGQELYQNTANFADSFTDPNDVKVRFDGQCQVVDRVRYIDNSNTKQVDITPGETKSEDCTSGSTGLKSSSEDVSNLLGRYIIEGMGNGNRDFGVRVRIRDTDGNPFRLIMQQVSGLGSDPDGGIVWFNPDDDTFTTLLDEHDGTVGDPVKYDFEIQIFRV